MWKDNSEKFKPITLTETEINAILIIRYIYDREFKSI